MAINVLIADDSVVARAVIIKTLILTNVELGSIYQAKDGKQALEIIENNWIDLVFLDINMPIMNGEEVVETLRESPLWAELPIIVVSTEGSETRIEHLKSMGARFIHKPFVPEALRKVILELTGENAHESRT
jgi:two-component system, chemotaxis family, chemotaxis protein CheY